MVKEPNNRVVIRQRTMKEKANDLSRNMNDMLVLNPHLEKESKVVHKDKDIHQKHNRFTFMKPSALAKCYGVSFRTFREWMKFAIKEDESRTITFFGEFHDSLPGESWHTKHYYKCEHRIISPIEVQKICELLGDDEFQMNFKKTTISSLAKEAGVSVKTAIRVINQYKKHDPAYNWRVAYKTRCLIPKNVKIFRRLLGLGENSFNKNGHLFENTGNHIK